jgi:oligoribonuclease
LLKQVEKDLIKLIDNNFESAEPVILGGNSIYNDRMFIINYCPRLNERLHYRMLDVSSWKIVFDGKYNKKFVKPNAHRALDDVRGSIEELKYYLKFMKV